MATQTSPQTARAVSKRKRRAPGPPVARWVWAGWLVFLGLAVAGDRLGLYSLSVSEGLAVLLGVVGAVLVVSAFRGGGRWLMPLAVVLAGSIFIARSVDWNAEYGSTTVADAAAWQGVDKGVGHVVVDLRSLDLAPSSAQVLTVPLNLGVGEVEVIVPSNVDLVVKTSIGAGEADLLDRHIEGAGLEDEWRFDVAEEVRTIELDVNIGLGRLRLTQGGLK